MDKQNAILALQLQHDAGRNGIQSSSLGTVCDVAQPDVVGNYAFGIQLRKYALRRRRPGAATHMSAM